jgi:hypothetical protein
MKNKKALLAILVMTLVIGIMFTSCKTEPGDPTYTVWTDTVTYSEFAAEFPSITLNDGYYARWEFTSAQWSQIAPTLTSEGKHNWTESEINNYFIGRGFGNPEANQQTAWLMTIAHGFIASRTGSTVYMLLK